jgi:parvulin-like peptidyl-prolyl isomerase
MEQFDSVGIAKVGAESVSLSDLIFHLKTDLNQNVLDSTIHECLLRTASKEMGITVSDKDLQAAADDFRRKKTLISAQETFDWLADNGLSMDEFERIMGQVASEEALRKIFNENITEFQHVKIGLIVVDKAGVAKEIVSRIQEGEADFIELSLEHSIFREVEENGGYMGRAYRNDLPYEVDARVFDENAPGLVGPIEVGDNYYIVKIYEKMGAEFDKAARDLCSRMLLDQFLQEKSAAFGVKVHILPDPPPGAGAE